MNPPRFVTRIKHHDLGKAPRTSLPDVSCILIESEPDPFASLVFLPHLFGGIIGRGLEKKTQRNENCTLLHILVKKPRAF